jgi:hypothetical protein
VSQSAPGVRALIWRDLQCSLRENSLLILFVLAYSLVPWILASRVTLPAAPYYDIVIAYVGFAGMSAIAIFAAFALWYLYHTRLLKVPHFQAEAARRIRYDFLTRERILLALPVLLLWPIFASAFTFIKSSIPLVQPYYFDATLHDWDRAIHFGIDPWRLLQPLLGYTWITYTVNIGYTIWFLVMGASLTLQAGATGNRKRRMQFLLTMTLAWALIGNLAATLISSAGPCYYALVTGDSAPYGALMDYLHNVAATVAADLHLPFTATGLQDMLWNSYVTNNFKVANGISAAPSMHIASSWIIARLAWSMGKRARQFGCLFLLMIFIGSIHLGWHYAVDGYLAIAGAWVLWRFTGWLLDFPAAQAFLWPRRTGNVSPAS